MDIEELPLALIGLDPRPERQIRPIDPDHVQHLVDETDPAEWDPIEVRWWPESDPKPMSLMGCVYQVISGYHRTTAAQRIGLKTIRAVVVDAPDDVTFTVRALRGNLRHGKGMTTDEKRVQVLRLKSLGMSESKIAEETGIPKGTVHNWVTGRNTNASRQPVRTHQSSEKSDAYASDLQNNWHPSPIPMDAERLRAVEIAVSDFLAGTPTNLTPRDVATWAVNLPPLTAGSIADDIDVTISWLETLRQVLGKSNAERGAELKAERKAQRKAGAA